MQTHLSINQCLTYLSCATVTNRFQCRLPCDWEEVDPEHLGNSEEREEIAVYVALIVVSGLCVNVVIRVGVCRHVVDRIEEQTNPSH